MASSPARNRDFASHSSGPLGGTEPVYTSAFAPPLTASRGMASICTLRTISAAPSTKVITTNACWSKIDGPSWQLVNAPRAFADSLRQSTH